MTERTRRRGLLAWLALPVLASPLLAFALMEYGPERSFMFAGYLLVWGATFLVSGVLVAHRRPTATVLAVLGRAALWATGIVLVGFAVLVAMALLLFD